MRTVIYAVSSVVHTCELCVIECSQPVVCSQNQGPAKNNNLKAPEMHTQVGTVDTPVQLEPRPTPMRSSLDALHWIRRNYLTLAGTTLLSPPPFPHPEIPGFLGFGLRNSILNYCQKKQIECEHYMFTNIMFNNTT